MYIFIQSYTDASLKCALGIFVDIFSILYPHIMTIINQV